MKPDVNERAQRVRLAIFDVDGVMTDGTIFLSATGELFKPFHILDGLGLKLLKASGVEIGVITGRESVALTARTRELGIDHVIQGTEAKLNAFGTLLQRLGLSEGEAAYMGDDLPDLPVLRHCGLAMAPADAVEPVRDCAQYVTARPGGRGAVREACEIIMRAQGTWDAQIGPYLK